MADIKTYGGFKDWALIVLLTTSLGMQYNTNSMVNELAKNDAVKSAVMDQIEKRQIRIEAEMELIKKSQQEQAADIMVLQDRIPPEEKRKKYSNR